MAMIKVTMIFGLERGLPMVYFCARSPAGKYSSFIAPLADLPAFIARAFFLMEVLG